MSSLSAQKYLMQSNNKSPNSNKFTNTNINISSQCFSTLKKSHNKKEKYSINCHKTLDKKEISSINYNNNINNENEEELTIVQSLWDDLGIYEEYQEEFKNYIKQMTNEEKKNEILNLEKNQLRKYRDALLKLSAEISNRENNIIKLKKLCKELDNYALDKNTDNLPSDIFENIQKSIKYYRINTVNVINKIIKLREISSYNELNKKWDPSMANRAYLYNKFYTIKMFNDIRFINNSVLFNYLQTDNGLKKTDLFLSNCKYVITNNDSKLSLSMPLELQSAINNCKYIILQDTLFNDINSDKKLFRQRNIMSPKTLGPPHRLNKKKSMSEISLINDKSEKKYFEIFGHKKVNLSRTLYYLKRTMGNQYEKMFFNSNNHKNNDKKNMEVMNKFFCFKSCEDNINDVDINLKKSNSKELNIKEYKLNEQLNKNNEDFKSLDVERNKINKIKTSDIKNLVNFESNLENITHKENDIIDETDENNLLDKSKEETIPPKEDNNKENKEENNINSTTEIIKDEKETDIINQNDKKDEKENDIINKNDKKDEKDNNNKEIKEQSNKSSTIVKETKNINEKINNNEKSENKDMQKNDIKPIELNQNENNKNIIESKPVKDNKENKEYKEIETNELIEEKEINNDDKEKEKEKGELEEKSVEENIKENNNNSNNIDDKGEFQEISLDNEQSKNKEGNSPKVKLLKYRRYTEEEIKKKNKEDDDDDDDEFINVNYDKI